MSNLVVVRNPFDRRQRDDFVIPAGSMTVAELIDQFGTNAMRDGVVFAVSINGGLVPQAEWSTRLVGEHDQMVVIPVVHGGGNGGLGAILSIALMVAAPYMATALYTAMGGTFVTSAAPWIIKGLEIGIGLVGSQLIGGLTAPPQQNLPSVQGTAQSFDASPTYSWQPTTTQEPGAPVGRSYGTMKLYGNIIAGFIESTGDTGREQTAHMLIDLGEGPYKALRDFKINDQDIGTYKGVTVVTRMGQLDQTVIEAFNDTRRTRPIGTKVLKDSPVVRTTVGNDYDALEIVLSFPNGLFYSNDSGGLSNVSVNFTVEMSGDDGVTWLHVGTTPSNSVSSGEGYWSAGQWTNTLTANTAEGQWVQYQQGSTNYDDHLEGEQFQSSLSFAPGDYLILTWRWISTSQTISTTTTNSVTVSAATQQPVRRTIRVDNLTNGTAYKIRVSNLSTDQTSSRYQDDLYLSEINEVLYDDFQYPRTVLVAVKALATDQISGGMKFSCVADCALVRIWDGTAWSIDFSKNPAWVTWDILTQPVFSDDLTTVLRYDGFNPDRLDLTSFYAWAQWCAVTVPNGLGGTEARCEFCGTFDTVGTMWDMALEVAESARATLVMRGTTVMAIHDHLRAAPTQMFNVANTLVDSFQETFLPMEDRAQSIEFEYLDQDQDFQRDKLTIVNAAVTENTARRIQLSNRGVTRASQVWRDCNFKLERNRLLRRSAELRVDIDAIECNVGNLVWVQDDVTQWGVGGRATDGTTMTVDLDKEVTLVSGTTYELRLRLADDTLLTRTITTAAGTVTSVEVGEAFPSAAQADDLWAIGEVGRAVKEFLITDVSRDGDQMAVLSLIEYNESLYGIDEGIPTIPTPNVAGTRPTVTNIVVQEVLETSVDGSIYVRLDLNFVLNNATQVQADISADGGQTWSSGRRTSNGVVSWYAVTSGATYLIAIAPLDYFKKPVGEWSYVEHTVVGKLAPPQDVTGFYMSVAGPNQALLTWDPAPDLDVQYGGFLELRHSSRLTGAEWEGAQVLASPLGASTRETVSLKSGTYLAKWLDSSGKYSTNVTTIETDLASALALNLVASYASHPSWSGVKTNTVVDTAKLKLDSVSGDVVSGGTYAIPRIDLGEAYACRISAEILTTAFATGFTWDGRTGTVEEWTSIDGAVRDMIEVSLWMRSTIDDPSVVGSWGPFQPHPVSADVFGRAFDFELRLYSFATDQNVFIEECTVVVDMADRSEMGVDVSYTSGTMSVTFAKPFFTVPAVSITAQSMAVGDFYTLTAKSETGFSIQFRNSGGSDIARTFDWFATGY